MKKIIEALKSEIRQSGITPPDSIEPGGYFNRFSDNGSGNKDGWCVLYNNPDGTAGGMYGNWKGVNNKYFYTPEGRQMTQVQESKLNEQIRDAKIITQQKLKKKQKESAIKAQNIWDDANKADLTHRYLINKNIESYGLRQLGRTLLIPVLDRDKICSLQYVLPDGTKKFMPGGKVKGGSFAIGNMNEDILYICEGYATAATIHKATGKPVVIAFNSGNLKKIAETYKKKHSSKTIIIASDNDIATEKKTGTNTGIEAARKAANAIDAKISICPVNSDFNDLQKKQGLNAVKNALKHPYETWEDPVIFKTPQLPVMSLDMFPDSIKQIVNAISEATETPVELAFGLTLSVLGTACQGKFRLEVEPGYFEPLNIWIVAALDPANRKSAVLSKVSQPLTDWERRKKQELETEIKDAKAKRKNQEAQLKFLRKKFGNPANKDLEKIEKEIFDIERNLIEVPVTPKLWAQDVTPEHLGTLMHDYNEQMSILSAEGGIFDIIAGRYSGGIPNLDLFLQSHSGDTVRVDRGSRESVYLDNPCLTLGLSPQPTVLKSIANKQGFRGRGLLARFMYFLPKSNLGYRKLNSTPVSDLIMSEYSNMIFSLLGIEVPEDECGDKQPYILRLSREAHHEWKEFSIKVETNLREGESFEYLTDWAGKLPGATARISALLHCAENPSIPWSKQICKKTMERACLLASIISQHTLAVFDLMGTDVSLDNARKTLRWIERNRHEKFLRSDCFNALQSTFNKASNMDNAFKILFERNYLKEFKHPTNGRPRVTYSVNPKIIQEWI